MIMINIKIIIIIMTTITTTTATTSMITIKRLQSINGERKIGLNTNSQSK